MCLILSVHYENLCIFKSQKKCLFLYFFASKKIYVSPRGYLNWDGGSTRNGGGSSLLNDKWLLAKISLIRFRSGRLLGYYAKYCGYFIHTVHIPILLSSVR